MDLWEQPKTFNKNRSLFVEPKFDGEIKMGPNIKPLPKFSPIGKNIKCKVMLSCPDNITTDHIMPAGANVLPYRSNIEKISEFCFYQIDEKFHDDCIANNGGIIVAGANYGQGSSREHAAIAPRYLGIKCVVAESFARIHKKNLINFGILPIEVKFVADKFDDVEIEIKDNFDVVLKNLTKNTVVNAHVELNEEEQELINKGGLLNLA